jgi:hypothetical protein
VYALALSSYGSPRWWRTLAHEAARRHSTGRVAVSVNARSYSAQRHVGQMLPWSLAIYAGASLLHFAHNAQHLAQYPNLPASWTRSDVYLAWCCVTAIGLLGYLLYRRGALRVGLSVLAIYGCLGLDALLHYTRAPIAHHSAAMNLTIWTEVVAAGLLLTNIARVAIPVRRP